MCHVQIGVLLFFGRALLPLLLRSSFCGHSMLRRTQIPRLLERGLCQTARTRNVAAQAHHAAPVEFLQSRAASTSYAPRPRPSEPNSTLLANGKERDGEQREKKVDPTLRDAAKMFESAGLNPRLSLQLVTAFPTIRSPTSAQQALLNAISHDNDIILRAHTGTGKSFGLLLGLLNKPRLVLQQAGDSQRREKRITSIIVVPSRELAMQYLGWAKRLFPRNMHGSLASVVSVKYRDRAATTGEHLQELIRDMPHVLVITATLLQDLLTTAEGAAILGVSTLRTLVYDEGDALLELPSRFPSQKLIWNHLKHPSEGLRALNAIMKKRATFSGGQVLPSAGLEISPTSSISAETRRRVHVGNDLLHKRSEQAAKQKFSLSLPKQSGRGERPLQLIVVSATANSVMRNFLGAKTGWLRTGLKDERGGVSGKWLDLTGLSKGVLKGHETKGLEEQATTTGWHLQLPKELRHSCIVVDEPVGDQKENWRLLHPSLARKGQLEAVGEEVPEVAGKTSERPGKWDRKGPLIVAPTSSPSPSYDEHLLTCLAFLYASQPVQRALALIPATWSIAKCRAFLADLDIPVRFLDGEDEGRDGAEEALYLIQANAVRGLDVPGGLSHVFNLGVESVRDTTNYTHLAGRAARIGHDEDGGHSRPPGHVITLVRGLSADQVRANRKTAGEDGTLSSSELKMSLIYKRLGVRVDKLWPLRYAEVQEMEATEAQMGDQGSEPEAEAEASSRRPNE